MATAIHSPLSSALPTLPRSASSASLSNPLKIPTSEIKKATKADLAAISTKNVKNIDDRVSAHVKNLNSLALEYKKLGSSKVPQEVFNVKEAIKEFFKDYAYLGNLVKERLNEETLSLIFDIDQNSNKAESKQFENKVKEEIKAQRTKLETLLKSDTLEIKELTQAEVKEIKNAIQPNVTADRQHAEELQRRLRSVANTKPVVSPTAKSKPLVTKRGLPVESSFFRLPLTSLTRSVSGPALAQKLTPLTLQTTSIQPSVSAPHSPRTTPRSDQRSFFSQFSPTVDTSKDAAFARSLHHQINSAPSTPRGRVPMLSPVKRSRSLDGVLSDVRSDGPLPKLPEARIGVSSGLPNKGNTCYLAAGTQFAIQTGIFDNYLKPVKEDIPKVAEFRSQLRKLIVHARTYPEIPYPNMDAYNRAFNAVQIESKGDKRRVAQQDDAAKFIETVLHQFNIPSESGDIKIKRIIDGTESKVTESRMILDVRPEVIEGKINLDQSIKEHGLLNEANTTHFKLEVAPDTLFVNLQRVTLEGNVSGVNGVKISEPILMNDENVLSLTVAGKEVLYQVVFATEQQGHKDGGHWIARTNTSTFNDSVVTNGQQNSLANGSLLVLKKIAS